MLRISRPFLALQPFHFLTVHDALIKFFPTADIKAFAATSKVHPFQPDMVCRVGGYERGDIVNIAQRLQATLLAVEISEVNNLVDVRFHDKEVLTLTMGIPDVTMADINSEVDLNRRMLLRESLGGSEELFMQYLDDTVLRATDYLMADFAGELDIPQVDLPPRSYFASQILHTVHTKGIANDINYALYAKVRMCARTIERPSSVIAPLNNPFCPGEDWHTLPLIKEFLLDIENEGLKE